jgi:hypothetical protein
MAMHLDRFPKLSKEILKAYSHVHSGYVMPSMRGMQFAGEAILKNNVRLYNCSAANIDDARVFGEAVFILLSGAGFGFSVQQRHVSKLPKITNPREEGMFVVQDSIIGWAQAVDILIEAYMFGRVRPQFDFSHIRPKGSYLVTTGAKAPGPEPLKKALELVEMKLKPAIGRKLSSIEVYDIVCILSDAVYAGGIRRAALICLFDKYDEEMLKAKQGDWWVKTPWRARSNNSALLLRNETSKEEFEHVYSACKNSGSGEPGFIWTNNLDILTNPCFSSNTLIHTENGLIPIKDLVGKTVEVFDGFEWVACSNFRVTGTNQEVLRITLHDGSRIEVTPNHTVILEDGSKKLAKDIVTGDRLQISDVSPKFGTKDVPDAYLKGFLLAEGTRSEITDKACGLLHLYEPKYMCYDRLVQQGVPDKPLRPKRTSFYLTKELKVWSWEYKSKLPDEVFTWNKNSIVNLLSGLFDGEGTASDTKNGWMYQLTSIEENFLRQIQTLLKALGVQATLRLTKEAGVVDFKDGYGEYKTKRAYRLTLSQAAAIRLSSLCKFERLVSFHHKKLHYYLKPRWNKVDKIESIGIENEVYCCTVPSTNSIAIANGIQIGQCAEIGLNSMQFCNLTTVNQTGITTEKHLMDRVHAATFLGTLQATYTDFPYLRPGWQEITEKEALLGVSFTGVADNVNFITPTLLEKAAMYTVEVNKKYAAKLGINPAARITCLKPEGSSSCVLGSSSGVHTRFADYYIRRIRMNKDDALAVYLKNVIPDLVEDDKMGSGVVVSIPQESPQGALVRSNETALTAFNRALLYNKHWVANGHVSGDNMHNVSVTISVKEEEWDELREAMWNNRNDYYGVSLLPYDGGTYIQAPFEECSRETYLEMEEKIKNIDLKQVREEEDKTNRIEQLACVGGVCEINI